MLNMIFVYDPDYFAIEWSDLGPAFAIIGWLIALFIYIKRRRIKRLNYAIHHQLVISKSISTIPGLKLIMRGQKIDTLNNSKISILNSGNLTIHKSDFTRDHLRILIKNHDKFLAADLFDTTFANNVNLDTVLDDQIAELNISFDYMDPNEQFTFAIWTSGPRAPDISIQGSLKGTEIKSPNKNWYREINSLATIVLTILFLFMMSGFLNMWPKAVNDKLSWSSLALMAIFLVVYMAYKPDKVKIHPIGKSTNSKSNLN